MKEHHYQDMYDGEMSHWWYRVRREMVHDIIATYFPVRYDLRILDVGCGAGALLSELAQYGSATGIDMSPKAVAFCRARGVGDVSVSTAERIAAPDAAFDIVLALDVLEHIKDDHAAVREMRRVLRPGGVAIVFVPAFMFLWGVTDVLSEHYRRYTRPGITSVFAAEELSIVRSSYFNTFLFPPIALIRLLVRLFRIPVRSENAVDDSFFNKMFYAVFHMESRLLRHINMPFGVSVLVIARKPI